MDDAHRFKDETKGVLHRLRQFPQAHLQHSERG
jgi:hypothetical protein